MSVRMPVVAGQFYEGSPDTCSNEIERMLPAGPIETELPENIVAGIVPHAGWMFSGDVAALVFAAIRQQQTVDTFVLFGAVHAVMAEKGLLYDAGQWGTPLGAVDVDEQLAEAILSEAGELIVADSDSHRREHSIEVQVPIIKHLFGEAKIVPLLVPPTTKAHEVGMAVARTLNKSDKKVVCIASTDLTHYGPAYRFTTMGCGPQALRWAKEQNDRFFIDLAIGMQADKIVSSAQMYTSACGAGAVAATTAAARQLGAKKGLLLAHTTSAEVLQEKYGRSSEDSVGYAGIVFG